MLVVWELECPPSGINSMELFAPSPKLYSDMVSEFNMLRRTGQTISLLPFDSSLALGDSGRSGRISGRLFSVSI